MGDIAKSWLGGGANSFPVSSSQIETLLGGQGDLLININSKLGIGGATASSALGYLLPLVIGKLTPGGSIPTSLHSDVMGFITGGASALTKSMTGAAGATAGAAVAATVAASKVVGTAGYAVGSAANAGVNAASSAGGGLMKWLPWLAAGIAALYLLSYFNKGSDAAKQAADGAKNAAATAADAAAAAQVVPAGSGLVAFSHDGAPALKVYFDSGKTAVDTGFADTAKALVEYLKTNASTKAVVSGFNDPTGNAAANAELSKTRAQGVATALKAAGIADDRVLLEKPADTTGSALSNSEARRVEVTIRK
jgi:outer membrane protein OmpA-like peptidoglycan-associated protein